MRRKSRGNNSDCESVTQSKGQLKLDQVFKELENKNLLNLEKLQYLHSSTRGNAAKIICEFSLKEANLKHCSDLLWDLLKIKDC